MADREYSTDQQFTICTKCQKELPATLNFFYKRTNGLYGLDNVCKECKRIYSKAWGEDDPKRKQKIKERNANWRAKNLEKARENSRAWMMRWYKNNPPNDASRERARARNAKKRALHPRTDEDREKDRLRAQRLRQNHPERIEKQKQAGVRYYALHADSRKKGSTDWRKAHPEQASANVKTWLEKHPHKTHEYNKTRRARKYNALINDLTVEQWEEIKIAYGNCCMYCGRKMQRLTQDHITPLSKGGNHTASNIVPACKSCNSIKGRGDVLAPIQPILVTIAHSRKTRK